MAILDLNLLDSDQTINESNADETNTVSISALGSQTLTVDGVSATVNSIAGVSLAAAPTFAAINDANLTVDYGSLGLTALSGVTYNVGDTSNVTVAGPDLIGLNLGTQTVNFSGNGAGSFTYEKGLIDTTSSFTVNGFDWGDSVGVDGYEFNNFSYDSVSGTGTLVLDNGAPLFPPTVTFTLTGLDPALAAAIQANPSSFVDANGQFVAPVCFLGGTLINTDKGEVAVEDLEAGDKVQCLGGLREVRWIGYRHDIVRRLPEDKRDDFYPVLIKRNAISDNVPSRDISVSPWHHIYVDGVLVRAMDLVNGRSIIVDKDRAAISYYHVELDQFDVILAHGLYSEAYADGGNRDFFHNAEVVSLRPEDRIRRRGERPGFHVARDEKLIHAMQKRFSDRALLSGEAQAEETLPTKLSA